jgi:hypothetical protein
MIRDRDLNGHNDQFLRLIQSIGPWPFTTQRIYQRLDHSRIVWRSRDHRKHLFAAEAGRSVRLGTVLRRCLWMPRQMNWWIGIIFAVGSFLFMVGSIFSLMPTLTPTGLLNPNATNPIFFAGSIPFTTAAYLQLFQAANADKRSEHRLPRSITLIGWYPDEIGWLSCALQFPGTLLFNVNTFDAMLPGLDWLQQDLDIWAPDFLGSVLFLVSGYLAFIETCHAHWAWKPSDLSWWITFVNLLGCIGFMVSALFALVLPHSPDFDAIAISAAFTLIGAVGFLIGSLLMLPETARGAEL